MTLLRKVIRIQSAPRKNCRRVQEGKVAVTGGSVWYRVVGTDRNETPLLVLHGGPGSPHDSYEPLEALSHERPVVFYDQLGCGNSGKSNDSALWTINRYARELTQLRKSLGLTRVHLLGHSWGATLAAYYVINAKPRGVISLTLSSPFLSTRIWERDQRRLLSKMPKTIQKTVEICEATGDFGGETYQKAAMEYYRKHLCRLNPWPECYKRSFSKTAMNIYSHMWGPSEFTITGTLRDFDCTRNLHKIEMPTLFLCGRFDEATPESTARFSRMVRDSELVIFGKSSHTSYLEQTAKYLNTLRSFMHRNERKVS